MPEGFVSLDGDDCSNFVKSNNEWCKSNAKGDVVHHFNLVKELSDHVRIDKTQMNRIVFLYPVHPERRFKILWPRRLPNQSGSPKKMMMM
jgi:hypothetical protein